MIWHQAVNAVQDLPDPTDFGYEVSTGGVLQPVWMTQAISPPELLNEYFCDCAEKPM